MTNINMTVRGAGATAAVTGPITSGAAGIPVTFCFDETWQDLIKTAVFRAGDLTLDRVGIGESTTLPAQITGKHGCIVYIGVYGASADGTVVIPTVWAEAGTVEAGADPSGDESTDPDLPVWQQLADKTAALDARLDDCIPAVEAQVGQTVVVKAVDETGRPTAWEAADLPEMPIMIVNLTWGEAEDTDCQRTHYGFFADKTLRQIQEAVRAGKLVFGLIVDQPGRELGYGSTASCILPYLHDMDHYFGNLLMLNNHADTCQGLRGVEIWESC